jgi:competence protein ComEC
LSAILIQTRGGRNVLVDGGPYPSVLNDQIGQSVPSWDRDVDLIIATHPDYDHVAGLPGVLERFEVGMMLTNGQSSQEESYLALMDTAAESAVPIHNAQAGEIIDLGDGVHLEILNPSSLQPLSPNPSHDNDQSIALRLVYDEFTLLLTGDAGDGVEMEMVESRQPLSAVVYQAGHHGAKSSSCKPFLRVVNPQYMIVSAGEVNSYSHPHPEVLERAADVGPAVLRTDEMGTIEVVTDGAYSWWESPQ